MPGLDGSGPTGNGPMSGGARGLCRSDARRQRLTDYERGSRQKMACRRGFGAQRGAGRGVGSGPAASLPTGGPDSKWEELEARITELQQLLAKTEQKVDHL